MAGAPVELRDLEYFLAVAEERSFTRGAQRSGVVQSAASAAVQRLERELGQRLLDRGTRGVELTDAGRLVLAGRGPCSRRPAPSGTTSTHSPGGCAAA